MKNIEILAERIKLRLMDENDLEAIHDLHSLPETDEFNALGIPVDIDETRTTIAPWVEANRQEDIRNYTFVIENISSQEFIGLLGLKLGNPKYRRGELWYKLHKDHWRKGYATEALKAVILFGFETLNLHRMQAGCAVNNVASIKVLEKVGMVREGRGRQVLPLKTGWSDNFEYSILETDL